MSDGADLWWMEAGGRTWGPYPTARLRGFREEGRFGPASLVARAEVGPFGAAGDQVGLAGLFEREVAAALMETSDAQAGGRADAPVSEKLRTLLVVLCAEEPPSGFAAAVGLHGEAVSLRPGLWLVKTPERPAALRNALSRRVRPFHALLVVDAPLSAAAWFNLDGDTDRALRRLWAESAPTG